MKITPPNDDGITIYIPYIDEESIGFTQEQYEYIKERLSKSPWICSECGLKNHYYNKRCANFRCNGEK